MYYHRAILNTEKETHPGQLDWPQTGRGSATPSMQDINQESVGPSLGNFLMQISPRPTFYRANRLEQTVPGARPKVELLSMTCGSSDDRTIRREEKEALTVLLAFKFERIPPTGIAAARRAGEVGLSYTHRVKRAVVRTIAQPVQATILAPSMNLRTCINFDIK
ncbi:hypothetical protein BDR03DRAFT_981313 [Suillus americanus]|nr:hypothetical protein BDR03DRAFT_981313 [Suillus americanus]